MQRPPLTPMGQERRHLAREGSARRPSSRGSISSVASTGKRGYRSKQQKYNTWNPRSSSKNPSRSWKTERGGPATPVRRLSSASGLSTDSASVASGLGRRKKEAPSVCVMVRIRAPGENHDATKACVEVLEPEPTFDELEDAEATNKLKKGSVRVGGPGGQVFTFDRIFGPAEGQETVFLDAGKPIAENALQGYNTSIFAYGQTGSGKTYTMQGLESEESLQGLIPRMLEYCFVGFEHLKSEGTKVIVHCSYLEIYNEQVFDLLDVEAREASGMPGFVLPHKQVRENMKRGVYVEGAVEECIENVGEAFRFIRLGAEQRHVGSTNMNRESSRSHSIFTLSIEMNTPGDETKGTVEMTRTSRINLVDLAGSERQRATKASGERLNEAKHINKSLSALGNVISALVERSKGRTQHVPHRDSVLTYLLRDSLGGNTKTSIIATISPDEKNFQDTLSTLQFGQRAKHIRNVVKANTVMSSDVGVLRREVKRLRDELERTKKAGAASGPEARNITPSTASVPNVTALLEQNKDFSRINDKVQQNPAHADPAAASQHELFQQRISHLELVLLQVLQELGENRETITTLKREARDRNELAEVLRDSVAAKDLVLQLHDQQSKEQDPGQTDVLKEAKQTAQELTLRAEIAKLRADYNAVVAKYKRKSIVANSTDEAAIQRRMASLQVQLEAVLEDKTELEQIVRDLGAQKSAIDAQLKEKTTALLKAEKEVLTAKMQGQNQDNVGCQQDQLGQQQSDADLVKALEEELKQSIAKAELLEEQLFLETERNALGDALSEQAQHRLAVLRTKHQSAVNRRRSAGDESAFTAEVPDAQDVAAGSDAKGGESADALVRKRLLTQLADARKQLKQVEQANKRLSVQLDRKVESARKQTKQLRKSLNAMENDADSEHMKGVKLEVQLQEMREKFERVTCNNKELQEAVEMANSLADFKEKQLIAAKKELEAAKQRQKKISGIPRLSDVSVKNSPSGRSRATPTNENNRTGGNKRLSGQSQGESTKPSARDSIQTVRMSAFGGGRDSLLESPRSAVASPASNVASGGFTPKSVAEFFPNANSTTTSLAKQRALNDGGQLADEETKREREPLSFRRASLERSNSSSSLKGTPTAAGSLDRRPGSFRFANILRFSTR
ncbi:Kinesin-like protein KIF15 (Kinesin-related protein KRP180) [Durusdinium trenchii]|uniref:Kinesin-like protein KIF15 (Kinesin-related protein KRP180) n=1 Tax=Durusdinium trenchii TaxID=1381693 RepID=A0ABP0R5W5_9DINO